MIGLRVSAAPGQNIINFSDIDIVHEDAVSSLRHGGPDRIASLLAPEKGEKGVGIKDLSGLHARALSFVLSAELESERNRL